MTTSFGDKLQAAVFYDRLNTWGGAERLLLDILDIFPSADLFTSVYNPFKTKWLKQRQINHTKLNGPIFQKYQALFSPIYPFLIEKFNFDRYHLVISLGTLFNNCLLTKPKTKYISYCLSPNRYLYQYGLFPFYKKIDRIFSSRPDNYFAISQTVAERIKTFYQRESQVIYPGIDTNYFKPSNNPSNKYYLVVSRLVPHKRVDLVVKAFKMLSENVIIVGDGREKNYLKKLAFGQKNIEFQSEIDDKKLLNLYQNCQALISPQHEDFGLTNLEAMACGKPVLAYGKGGNQETVVNLKTGILFDKQEVESLIGAIHKLKNTNILTQNCQNQAIKFSRERFMLNFKNHIHATLG